MIEENKAKKILDQITYTGLRISRIPESTKVKFIALANEEFCGDYGMLIKFLIDDLIDGDVRDVMSKLVELENRIIKLETKTVNEKKTIKLMNGKRIEVKQK